MNISTVLNEVFDVLVDSRTTYLVSDKLLFENIRFLGGPHGGDLAGWVCRLVGKKRQQP